MAEHVHDREIVIDTDGAEGQYWRDVWEYRELFYYLAWRNVVVRYKQTLIGIAWAVIRPVLSIAVFTVIFGRIAKLDSSGVPYPVLVAAGTMPWQFFASAFTDAAVSLTNNPALVSKIYFPRVILPGSACITNVVDLLIGLGCLLALMLWYAVPTSPRLLLLPCFIFLALTNALGLGLWLSALNSRYRDVRVMVPFLAQMGLYFSPVGFSSHNVPERWQALFALNPMVAVIDGARWCLIESCPAPSLASIAAAVILSALGLVSGVSFFRKLERTLADVI